MRHVLFVVLAAVPPLLAVWILWNRPAPVEEGGAPPPAAEAGKAPSDAVPALLAAPPAGARPRATVRSYGPDDLFDYINGGAPAYLDRGFVRLTATELTDAGGAAFVCDVYDMGTPANAQAIAESERTSALAPLGDWPAAAAGGGVLFFREGRWYVKLTALDGKAALEPFARALRAKLP